MLRELGRVQLDDFVECLSWSDDGQWLLAAEVSGPLHWFAGDLTVRGSCPGHPAGTTDAAWQPKSERLVSIGLDGMVKLWQAGGTTPLRQCQGPDNWLTRLGWSRKFSQLAVAGGRCLHFYDPELTLLRACGPYESTLSDMAWFPHLPEVVTASYRGLQRWSSAQVEPKTLYRWQGSSLVLAISPNQNYIATGDQDCTVHFWRSKRPFEEESAMMSGFSTKVQEMNWDSTSRFLATGGSSDVTLWDCVGKGPEDRRPLILKGNPKALIRCLSYRPKSLLLASGNELGGLSLWRQERSPTPWAQAQLEGEVVRLAWSPNGALLASGTSQGWVQLWDVAR